MNMQEFVEFSRAGNPVSGRDRELHQMLVRCSEDARRVTLKLNNAYTYVGRDRSLIRRANRTRSPFVVLLFSAVPYQFWQNIVIGENVFFNRGCQFQNRDGITIGDGTMIGMNVTIATLNYGLPLETRNTTYASPGAVGRDDSSRHDDR